MALLFVGQEFCYYWYHRAAHRWLGIPPLATWIPKLWAPVEWLFNTPAHHQVHHASNPEHLDCNYGGLLIVFDRLFGSFVNARDDVTLRYGLVGPLNTYNPVRIALHEWVNLARDLVAAHNWRTRWMALFGAPGAIVTSPGTAPRARRHK